MRVRYIGETRAIELTHGKEYDVMSIERGWYRIETDLLGDYLYPAELFEIVKGQSETKTSSGQETENDL